MEINDEFYFPKYKGKTLKTVYCGQQFTDENRIKDFVKLRINQAINSLLKPEWLSNVIETEVSLNLIKLVFTEDNDLSKNFADKIRWLLYDSPNKFNRNPNKSPTFEEFINSNCEQKFNIYGDLPYIIWCIKNVKEFVINPKDIIELQNFKICWYSGFQIDFKGDGLYEYKPRYLTGKYKFRKEIITINADKWDYWTRDPYPHHSDDNNEEIEEDDDHYYQVENDRYYREEKIELNGRCPMCEEYPCMCSDPDPD